PYPQAGPQAYPSAYPPPYPSAYAASAGGARPDRNWMGITSLVLGLLGGGLLGAIFGGLGISAAKEGRATNKTMATWGLVLNIAIPVLLVGGFVVMGIVSGGLSDDQVRYDKVAVGECVQTPPGWNDEGKDFEVQYFTRVACDEEHWGQVYHRGPLGGGAYPSDDELMALSEEACYSEEGMAKIVPEHFDEAYVAYFFPTRDAWNSYDRSVVCFTFDGEHALSESWVVEP
ncbi:MAG: hypothetical protein HGA51_11015, partial [Demequinaceae bacterium]|nr:hypothetical protein [Demequinaceae bacterium]